MKSRTFVSLIAIAVLVSLPVGVSAAQGANAHAEQGVAMTPANPAAHPVPFINQPLVPDAVKPGGAGFTLTINGTGFVSGSVVKWNGSARTTRFVSGSRLTASILASDIHTARTASVTVFNPSPGGGASNVVFFEVMVPNSYVSFTRADYGVGSAPNSLAVADFNQDGKLDVVASNYSGDTVSVLLGNGNGTFQAHVDYATQSGPDTVVVGDFNRDGKLDLAVRNQSSNTVSVLLGNGDGTFQPAASFAVGLGTVGSQVAVGDFNGDGNLDLVASNYNDNTISVLLGKGDGTFQNQMVYAAGSGASAIGVGDFNGDGKLDIVITNSNDVVSVLLGNGNGSFQAPVTYATAPQSDRVNVADLNGDGILDLVVTAHSGAVSVLLGNGNGTFHPHTDFAVPAGALRSELADLNGDGKLDLIVAPWNGSNVVSLLLGNGDGTFQAPVTFATGSTPDFVAVGDFDRKGRLDLAVADNDASAVSILLQNGTVALSPNSVNFGTQIVGSNSLSHTMILTNIGGLALSISSIAVTGNEAADFSETNTCGTGLSPGGHCTITVVFTPTQLGPRAASIAITDNAPGSPQSVALSGIGVVSGPNVTLSATSLTFVTQLVGTTSPAQSVTLSNYGTQALSIASIIASGDFKQTNTCGSSLAVTASCTINVTFTPAQRGSRTADLSITDNAPDSPQKVNLTGTGTVVEFNPSSLNFGLVPVGQHRSQQTMLTNTGKTQLHITDIVASPAVYVQQNNCPKYLGARKFCTITVTFGPTQRGTVNGDVSVSDDGGGSPQQVGLSGTGCTYFEHRCVGADEGLDRATARSALVSSHTVAVPGPSGSSDVGTRVARLVDYTRNDPLLVDGSKRELLVRFWYPAASGQPCKRAAYVSPKVWGYFSQLMGIPGPEVNTNSCQDAVLMEGVHPIVVVEPGYTGTFTDYTFIAEDLASRGYVVVAVDHTYEATAVEFPDGRLVPGLLGSHFDNSWRTDDQTLSLVMSTRSGDLKFVVDELERLNASSDSPFAGKLDVSRIALMGHSLGVLAVLSGIEQEPRFKVGVTLDGVLIDGFAVETDKPILMMAMGRSQWIANECKLWGNLRGTRLAVNLKGAEHITPTDAVWLARGAINTSTMGLEKTMAAVRDYIAAFLDAHLQGKVSDHLLSGPSSEYPDAAVITQEQSLCSGSRQ